MKRTALGFAVAGLLLSMAGPADALAQQQAPVTTSGNYIAPNMAQNPANPSHLVLISGKRTGTSSATGDCMVFVSRDGGATWNAGTKLAVPAGTVCRRIQPTPKVTFGKAGAVFVAYMVNPPAPTPPVADPTTNPPSPVPSPNPIPPPAQGRLPRFSAQPRILVARSDDGGTTFSAPVTVATIQEHVGHDLGTSVLPFVSGACVGGQAAGCVAGGLGAPRVLSVGLGSSESADYRDFDIEADPNTGDVYIAWNQGVPGTYSSAFVPFYGYTGRHRPIWFASSQNGGASFSIPYPIYPPKGSLALGHTPTLIAPVLRMAGDKIYLAAAWASCRDAYDRLSSCLGVKTIFTSSSDRGASFAEPVAFGDYIRVNFAGGRFVRTDMAVHPTDPNLVYVVWEDETQGDNSSDVYLARSTDGGKTWSNGQRLADDPAEAGFPHERPAIGVAPNGRVDVIWYDGRNDFTTPAPCNDAATCTGGRDVYYTSSLDSGATFSANERLTNVTFSAKTRQLNSTSIPGSDALLNAIGLVSTDAGPIAVWEQSRGSGSSTIWDLIASRPA